MRSENGPGRLVSRPPATRGGASPAALRFGGPAQRTFGTVPRSFKCRTVAPTPPEVTSHGQAPLLAERPARRGNAGLAHHHPAQFRARPRPDRDQGRLRRGRLRRLHRGGAGARRQRPGVLPGDQLLPAAAAHAPGQAGLHGRVPQRDGALHPVQQAWCASSARSAATAPRAWSMSMFEACYRDRLHRALADGRPDVRNLCRCTGYRPIRDATRTSPAAAPPTTSPACSRRPRRSR